MVGADDAADREVPATGAFDVRNQVQAAGSDPRSLHDNVGQVDRDQLAVTSTGHRRPGSASD